MPKIPIAKPPGSPQCDPRLPLEALAYRQRQNPPLTTPALLGGINVTVWLYRDRGGKEGIQVNPNITIRELIEQFGPAETRDAEVGIHSEGRAAEWFRRNPEFKVTQIFTERIPCPRMCAPLLDHYFPGVPWYYYYDIRSWKNTGRGQPLKTVAEILKSAYGL